LYQQVTVIGRVGKDLEMKGSVGKFSVACTERWIKDGDKHEKTVWFNCNLFGKKAEGVGKYILKGGLIHVTGRIATSEYQGKHYWSVNVHEVTLLSKPPDAPREPARAPVTDMDSIPF
jgi:single-strand DNA-binding protein